MPEREDEEKARPTWGDDGVDDTIIGLGEPLTGQGTEEDQEEAQDFLEEIGAIIEGKGEGDVHHPDMVDEAE
ncbi:MAG: hypothetical protein ACRDIB_07305 [Ardenticatenaceae bacterium]